MTQPEAIDDYAYLWTDTSGRYVLVQTGNDDSTELETCLVYDRETDSVLLIEDDSVSLAVMKRLHELGISILPNVPNRDT